MTIGHGLEFDESLSAGLNTAATEKFQDFPDDRRTFLREVDQITLGQLLERKGLCPLDVRLKRGVFLLARQIKSIAGCAAS